MRMPVTTGSKNTLITLEITDRTVGKAPRFGVYISVFGSDV